MPRQYKNASGQKARQGDRTRDGSADEKALISAEDQDGGQEDPEKKIVLRQKQSDKDPDPGPEQDKTQSFFHG
jgi:hypothetical protein